MRSILIAALFCALPLAAADHSGIYKGEASTSSGKVPTTLVLKAAGKNVTGTLTNQFGELPIQDGAVDMDDIFFAVVVNDEGHPFRMVYRGRVFGDTEIQFRIEAGERQLDLILRKLP